jgi:hypothetical protein
MTYQGERARPEADEKRRVFEVSAIRFDPDGWPTEVLWAEISAKSNLDVSKPVLVPVADVVDALQDEAQVMTVCLPPYSHLPARHLIVFERKGEADSITHAPLPGHVPDKIARPDLHGVATLAPEPTPLAPTSYHAPRIRHRTFAVSRVALDQAGRITKVLWGPVDTLKNDWAGPEVIAPVAVAVEFIRRGGSVFALFPSEHGHLPDRRFVIANYDDGRQTLVLDGPTAYERDIHDMDRLELVSS